MSTHETRPGLSRRTAIAGFGAAGLGLSVSGGGHRANAQDAAHDLADHPLTGTWAAMTPGGIVPQIHGADGSMIAAFPANYVDPVLGLTFQGPALGQWAADGDHTGHFTFIQALSDSDGAYLGTAQLSAGLEASADGQSWTGVNPTHIIIRDAANNITMDESLELEPSVTAIRIGATSESVVIPIATPSAATPTP